MTADLSDVPGAEHAWLRRLLLAPAIPIKPPLTLSAVNDARRRIALHCEHGLLSATKARASQRMLDAVEAEIREDEGND
jgi:hypothetical protein